MGEEREDRTKIRILTEQFVIIGEIAMFPDTRLTDYIIGAREFVAITNAEVRDLEGQKVFCKTEFLDVQKDKIIIITPEQMVESA